MTFLLLAAAAAAVQPVPAPGGKSTAVAQCPRTTSYQAYRSGEAVKPHKLTELPAANMYSGVYRHDEHGCESPIVVRYGVGRR